MRAAFGRDEVEQRAELIALAPESDDQHATCIGMLRKRGKQRARVAKIVAELRTAKGMFERMDAVDASRMALARDPRNACGKVADAADRRQYPYLVARSDASVGTNIAAEGRRCLAGLCRFAGIRRVQIIAIAAQRSRQIVAVDMLAGGDVGGRGADWKAIFDHRRAARDRLDRDLVPTSQVDRGPNGGIGE